MITIADILLTIVALGLLVPALVLAVECIASLRPARPVRLPPGPRPRVAVIVPAHNEAARIETCLTALAPQLGADDRVIVVADNCVDDTAKRAQQWGATVLERNDTDRAGKGYALLYALDVLTATPPDVVLMIDADSLPHDGLVETLSCTAARMQRPVQAAYFPEPPLRAGGSDRIATLAFIVKNVTRPRGLARLGLPCLLTGTGMAFPWHVIRAAPIAGTKTAEDMRLAVDVSMAGAPPMFCPDARITGPLRSWKDGATLQRTRWEHGHLETILERGVPLFLAALRQRSLSLLALAFELSVPPLALWCALWTITALSAAGLVLIGAAVLPLGLTLLAGLLVAISVAIAWACDGRTFVSARDLLGIGWYVARKMPIYAAYAQRRQSQWALSGTTPSPQAVSTEQVAEAPHAVRIGPCTVHVMSEAELVRRVIDGLDAGQGGWIITLNLDHLWHVARDAEYAALCARGTFAVADGMPLVWASWLQGTPLPERVAGSNLIGSLSAAAAQHSRSIFLVGGMPGDADAAAAVLRNRHPSLRLAGVRDASAASPLPDLAEELRTVRPDIVYVSLGKIVEERLIERLRKDFPDVWFMGVGTSFAFLSGRVRRAPPWMWDSGLEWTYRWTQEPRRLTGRYLRCIPLAIRLLGTAAVHRARRTVAVR